MIAIIDMDDESPDVDVESVCNALAEILDASDVRVEQMLDGKAKAIREVVKDEKKRNAWLESMINRPRITSGPGIEVEFDVASGRVEAEIWQTKLVVRFYGDYWTEDSVGPTFELLKGFGFRKLQVHSWPDKRTN